MNIVCIVIVWFAVIGCSIAREIPREDNRLVSNSLNDSKDTDVSSSSSSSSSDSMEPRKRKPYHDLFLLARKSGFSTVYAKPLHGIAFMGGLQSLIGFVIIKIKIVLVTVAIIGAVALALKVFGVMKYADYYYKNNYPPVATSPEFHGYHGPPPPSPITYDHGNYANDWSSYAEHYARSSDDKINIGVNMREIVYSMMHADREDCRSRVICELKMLMTKSPFFDYFMRFDDYRTKDYSESDV